MGQWSGDVMAERTDWAKALVGVEGFEENWIDLDGVEWAEPTAWQYWNRIMMFIYYKILHCISWTIKIK